MQNYLYKPRKSTLWDKIQNAPLHVKLIGGGGLLSAVGCFLPWYAKSFGSRTETFNGLQDMTYLIGYIVLVLGLFSLILSLYHVFNWKLFKLPVKEHWLHIFSAVQIVMLGFIAWSIYNAAYEMFSSSVELKFGLTVSMVGGTLLFFGGYLGLEEEKRQEAHKTFIHLPEEEDNNLHELLDDQHHEDEEATPPHHDSQDPMF